MEEQQRKCLVRNSPTLIYMDLDWVLLYLKSKKVLDDQHEEEIEAKMTNIGKVIRLIQIIQKQGPNAFNELYNALSNQPHLANLLKPELSQTKTIHDQVDSEGLSRSATEETLKEKLPKDITSDTIMYPSQNVTEEPGEFGMKHKNIIVLKRLLDLFLQRDLDVIELCVRLRGVLSPLDYTRIAEKTNSCDRCKLLFNDILPAKDDSVMELILDSLKEEGLYDLVDELTLLLKERDSEAKTERKQISLAESRFPTKIICGSEQRLQNELFTGREAELQILSSILLKSDTPKQLDVCCLSGIGGIGKTSIALEFINRMKKHQSYEQKFSFIAWLKADSAPRFLKELEDMGKELGIPHQRETTESEIIEAVKIRLAQKPGWLLVVDDLSVDAITILKKSLPISGGSVLITSRLRILADWITRIEIAELSESVKLLEKVIGPNKPADFENLGKQLASKTLGGLPLAIVHAGMYLKCRPSCTIRDYLKRFENSPAILNEEPEWVGLAELVIAKEAKGTMPQNASLPTKVLSAKDDLRESWNLVAGQRNFCFTGREGILQQLNRTLVVKDPTQLATVILTGTGGIGKSAIALEFCHQVEQHFTFIAWLRANSARRLVEELESLGEILGIPKPPQGSSVPTVKNFLAANPGWLLVVDDLSKDALDVLEKSLPTSGGAVLITSRLQVHADWIDRIEVGELSESVELLEKVIGKNKPADFEQLKEQLASKTLGSLPLAIMQAGSYLKLRPSCTIADYLERFEQSAAILNKNLSGVLFYGEKQVLTTWDVTMEFLRRENKDTYSYLGICSFFANEIEDRFMNSAPIFQESSESETKERVEDAKTLLISFSMLTPMDAGVKIHALVQEAVLLRSSEEEKLSSFVNGAAILDKNRDRDLNPDRLRKLFVHGELMLRKFFFRLNLAKLERQDASIIQESNYDLVVAVFLNSVHNLRIKLRENFLGDILETGEALFGVHSHKMGDIFYWVGLAFGVGGNREKEREFLEKALKLREDLYGLYHFKVATTLYSLGFCFYQLGDLRRAIEILEKALDIFQNFHEDEQEEIADTLNYLGFCYGRLGEHQKEKEILERSREILESLYGPHHIKLAGILDSLGNCYRSFGDFQKMKEMHEAALKIKEGFYGKDHVAVATSLSNISNYYDHTGDHIRRKELLERALSIYQAFYGDINHFEIALVLNNLGNCYIDLGDFHRAKEMLEKALKMRQSLFGENHFEAGQTLNNLALCYGDLGDEERKREMLERALKIQESFFGGNHEDVAMTLSNLGAYYFSLKNNSQSIVSLKRAIEIFKSGFNVVGLFNCYLQMSKTLLQISKESNSTEAVKNLRESKLYLEKARSLLQENRDNPMLYGLLSDVEEIQKEVDRLKAAPYQNRLFVQIITRLSELLFNVRL